MSNSYSNTNLVLGFFWAISSSGNSMRTALAFENLTLGYDSQAAVNNLEADIAEGSLTAVVGPNGAGKSTLLRG